jgi:preprotein translocase subunit YajC
MLFDWLPTAFAATTTTTNEQAPGGLPPMVLLGGLLVLVYFLMWYPQSKRAKEHRNLLAGLQKGDEVTTSGGIVGRVLRITDDFVVLSLAEGQEVVFQKVAIVSTLPKGTIKSV